MAWKVLPGFTQCLCEGARRLVFCSQDKGNNSLNTGYRAALSLFNEQHILSHNDGSFIELDQHPSTERKGPHLESQGP